MIILIVVLLVLIMIGVFWMSEIGHMVLRGAVKVIKWVLIGVIGIISLIAIGYGIYWLVTKHGYELLIT